MRSRSPVLTDADKVSITGTADLEIILMLNEMIASDNVTPTLKRASKRARAMRDMPKLPTHAELAMRVSRLVR